MMKKSTITSCITTLLFAGFGNSQVHAAKPNIIYILADDLGYGDLSCYNPNSKISTPNIDKLASEGMSFTDAHSGAALSTPSRYGILTGRFCFRSGLKAGVLGAMAEPLIEKNRTTVGGFLKQNGYNTACIGKWHLGFNWSTTATGDIIYEDSIQGGPVDRGFDYYFGINGNADLPYCFIENKKTVGIPSVQKEINSWSGLMVPDWTFENILPSLTNKAIDYINNASTVFKRDSSKPFFLYFALNAPHDPIAPIDSFIGTSQANRYGDIIQQIDWEVGKVLKALKDQGLDDNTIVIFSSDNGPMHWDGTNMRGGTSSIFKYGHNPSYIFRGKKSDIWEAGHRLPFIVRWPGRVAANVKNDEMISEVDFMATCAGIVGKSLPTGAGEDSYNLLPVLTGQNYVKPFRKSLLNHSGSGKFGLRQGNWKLILAGGSGGFTSPASDADATALGLPLIQLYDLSNDIGETNNLQALYPEKVREMTLVLDLIKRGSVIATTGSVYANNILEFDGSNVNSYVNCAAQAAFTPPNFTIEFWANITSTVDGTTLISNAGTVGSKNQGYTLKINNSNKRLEASVGTGTNSWQPCTGSGTQVAYNTWNHIAMVNDGTNVNIYLNGVLNSTTVLTAPIMTSTKELYLGEHPSFTGRKFSGQMSDVRIWNIVRTSDEIKSTMNGFLKGNELGLVANWKLDEGTGLTINDLTTRFNATRKEGTKWVVNIINGEDENDETALRNVLKNTINIWPTVLKSGGILNIGWNLEDENPRVKVFSLAGQRIDALMVDDGNIKQLDTKKLTPGFYLLDIVSSKKHHTVKFVIK